MNKKQVIILASVLTVVVLAGVGIYALNKKDNDNKTPSTASSAPSQTDSTSATYKKYAALKGANYDRNFIADMMVHHQGAIDMANLALSNSARPEIKTMASDIVNAQSSEISQMKQWQKDWGYVSASSGGHDMTTMDNMAVMTSELKGKTGSEFDKAFLTQMIMHHESAIDMARPAASNAQRQEVKDLAKAIITAQTAEIAKMKQWQKDWGY